MADGTRWPRKTRELHNHHFDSTIWNDFVFRDDDIVIATYAKAGTTWMQQIVGQLLFRGEADLSVAEMSPWLDLRVPPKDVKLPLVEAQTHRRFLKTHLPVDALRFSPRAKYLYIGRDGRDVVWSGSTRREETKLAAARIGMAGLAAGTRVRVLFEDREIRASAGAFTDDFRGADLYQRYGGLRGYGPTPVAVHVYAVPTGSVQR